MLRILVVGIVLGSLLVSGCDDSTPAKDQAVVADAPVTMDDMATPADGPVVTEDQATVGDAPVVTGDQAPLTDGPTDALGDMVDGGKG